MNEWEKWALGIVAALFVASVLAVGKLLSGKANRTELVKAEDIVTQADLEKHITAFDADMKVVNARIDQFVALFGQAVSKTDLLKDLNTAAARGDDRDLRVQKDITELKADVKATIEKLAAVDKKLDELPTRVASLEQTRNQQK